MNASSMLLKTNLKKMKDSMELILKKFEMFGYSIERNNYEKISKEVRLFEGDVLQEIAKITSGIENLNSSLNKDFKFFTTDDGYLISNIVCLSMNVKQSIMQSNEEINNSEKI